LDSSSSRPWYRLHWLTWLVVAVVVGASGNKERQSPYIPVYVTNGKRTWHGWPKICLEMERGIPAFMPAGSPPNVSYHWVYPALVINVLVWLALTGSTAFIVERWLRNAKRFQLSLGTTLAWLVVFGIVMTMLNGTFNNDAHVAYMPGELVDFHLPTWGSLQHSIWWPLLFALACTIFTSGWLAWHSALLGYRSLRRSRN
jgi:hypothetical protein